VTWLRQIEASFPQLFSRPIDRQLGRPTAYAAFSILPLLIAFAHRFTTHLDMVGVVHQPI
jgi:hypothetical protein